MSWNGPSSLLQLLGPQHVDAGFLTSNRATLRHRRGAGLWLWKVRSGHHLVRSRVGVV